MLGLTNFASSMFLKFSLQNLTKTKIKVCSNDGI